MKLYKSICFSFIGHTVEKYYRKVNMYTKLFQEAGFESGCSRMAKVARKVFKGSRFETSYSDYLSMWSDNSGI